MNTKLSIVAVVALELRALLVLVSGVVRPAHATVGKPAEA
jgi:hypothetical protein